MAKSSITYSKTGQSSAPIRRAEVYPFSPITLLQSKYPITDTESWCLQGIKDDSVMQPFHKQEVISTSALPGGNRNNDGTFNNVGNNGNWWTATQNDASNAWKRNLNNSNATVNRNNNNKAYGFSVRCVKDWKAGSPHSQDASEVCQRHPAFILSEPKSCQVKTLNSGMEPKNCQVKTPDRGGEGNVLVDLFQAYYDCRSNKRNTANALEFELNYESNLIQLHEEIVNGTYAPDKSIAFIVNKPVKREVFAAGFRDRVVHHFIINKLNPLFEKQFIYDSYACRVGKGTHFGISRINRFIRQCSANYTTSCYILKLDISGFFMHINKNILFDKLNIFIQNKYLLPDKDLLIELSRKVIFNNPIENCIVKGKKEDWKELPPSKSLFHSPLSCGLPIGNLTSQVFANFYLNSFDHFIKHDLGIRYYGRYVDDFVIVHNDKEYLKTLISTIRNYLFSQLQLDLHPKKIYLQHYSKGLQFLGTIIKPHRIYIAKRTKGNFYQTIAKFNKLLNTKKISKIESSEIRSNVNSYLGIMKHYKTYRLRKKMLTEHLTTGIFKYFYISGGYYKLIIKKNKILTI